MASKEMDDLSKILSQSGVGDDNGVLSFEGRGLKLNDEESVKEIVRAIDKIKELKVLELKGNTLGIDASRLIGEALEKHSSFKRALWSDLFTGRDKSEIPAALKNLCEGIMKSDAQLVELDLSDNAFGPNGMTGLVDFLSSASCHTLHELRLNNNGLGVTGGKMLADCLITCYDSSLKVGQPMSLKTFVSGRGRLENEGAFALSKPFKLMGTLREVVMPQNGINHAGVSSLARALSHNPALTILNLSDNTFTEKGSLAMAKALQKLSNLEEINFEDCLLRTSGALAIGNALKNSNPHLKVLKLSGNEIRVEGGVVVVEGVVGKKGLQCLELNANQFGQAGIEKVKGVMEEAAMVHVLGSFSDDEGSDDEDEEDDDDAKYCIDDDDDGVEEDEDTDDGSHDNDGGHDNDRETYKDATKLNEDHECIENFLLQPTSTEFNDLLASRHASFNSYLEDKIDQLDFAIMSLMKLSALCEPGATEINESVFRIADEFLCRVFAEVGFAWVANSLLISLGLIKGEQKKVCPPPNINGALLLVDHVCKQDYFKTDTKLILKNFINMKQGGLDCDKEILSSLLLSLS